MQIVPLQPVPSQIVSTALNNQSCTINVYTLSTGLYCDLYVNNILIIGGVVCQNNNVIVRDAYLGFIGDIAFEDTQGNTDPIYSGLGTRYILCYFLPSELIGVS